MPSSNATPPATRYRLGALTVDPELNQVLRDGESIHLEPTSMDLLVHLIANAPRVVSSDELLERFWTDTFVESSTIHRRIAQIRRALGDSARDPTYIETVPKRGYRVIAPAQSIGHSPDRTPTPSVQGRIDSGTRDSAARAAGAAGAAEAAGLRTRHRLPLGLSASMLIVVFFLASAIIVLAAYGFWRRDTPTTQNGGGPGDQLKRDNRAAISQTPKVAVLPFQDLSPSDDYGYLAAGFQEDVLNKLSRIRGLEVTSRTSVMRYAESNQGVEEIAQTLGVSHALEGSVRRDEQDRLRVNVQLIDTSSDSQLWAETYDGELSDLFQLQSTVAQAVASQLDLVLAADLEAEARAAPTTDIKGYELVLEARGEIFLDSVDSLARAESLLLRAIRRAPELAEAHALLAETLVNQARFNSEWADVRDRAEASVSRALKLDPSSATAHIVRARIAEEWQSDPNTAAEHYLEAIELEPNNSYAQLRYADFLVTTASLFDEALPFIERARTLDPMSPEVHQVLVYVLMNVGKVDEAFEAWQRGRTLAPEDLGLLSLGLGAMLGQNDLSGLLDIMVELIERDPKNVLHLVNPVGVLIYADEIEAAKRWVDRARSIAPTHEKVFDNQLVIHLATGDRPGLEAMLDQWRSMNSDRRTDKVWDGLLTPFEVRCRAHLLTLQADEAHKSGNFGDERMLRRSAVETVGEVLRGEDGSLKIIEDNITLATNHAKNLLRLGRQREAMELLTTIAAFQDPFNETHSETFRALMMKGDIQEGFVFATDRGVARHVLRDIHDDELGLYEGLGRSPTWPAFYRVKVAQTETVSEMIRENHSELIALTLDSQGSRTASTARTAQ